MKEELNNFKMIQKEQRLQKEEQSQVRNKTNNFKY